MRIILSDTEFLSESFTKDAVLIKNNGEIHNCIGCFGCWIKTPGECIVKDGYENLGKQFSNCSELIIVSKCVYGSVSPFVKNVLDRGLPYLHPSFEKVNGEMHHKKRYDNAFEIIAYFYGDNISEGEKLTAQKLISANAVNLHASDKKVLFFNSIEELMGEL